MPFGGGKKKRIAEFLKAAEDGDAEAVERLLTKGVGADEQNEGGWSAVALAANGGHSAVLHALQRAGADLEVPLGDGRTALILATSFGKADCVKLLLGWGANPDAAKKDGFTALHTAAKFNKLESARLLVEAGANCALRDKLYGRTALEHAEEHGHEGIAALLAGPAPVLPSEPEPEPELNLKQEPAPDDALGALLSMGYSEPQASQALTACAGDVGRAVEMLGDEQSRQDGLVRDFTAACFTDEATARGFLERAGWVLRDAMLGASGRAEDCGYLPSSSVAGRTLEASNFKPAYIDAAVPEGPMDLGGALTKLLEGHCASEGIEWKAEGLPFLQQLQKEAMRHMDDPIEEMMQRMWTSALRLRDREFCFILNSAVRGDAAALADATAALSRGINTLCVTAGTLRGEAVAVTHPPNNVCLRGGGFDDKYRGFFVQGRKFRQPAFLATSFSEQVARKFIGWSSMPVKCLWRVRIDPERKCGHVNLVRKTNVQGEEEYLFAPYSAFEVLSVSWNAGTDAEPHVIELLAAVDNKAEPEDLPLAPWS